MSRSLDVEAVLAFSFEVKSFVTELNAALTAAFRPLGLTCVQADALMALATLGSATLKELSAHLVAESGHPSRLVSRLVERGLIARSESATDRRAVTLELTELGAEMAARARTAREPLLAEFARRYGTRLTETTDLIRALRQDLSPDHPG